MVRCALEEKEAKSRLSFSHSSTASIFCVFFFLAAFTQLTHTHTVVSHFFFLLPPSFLRPLLFFTPQLCTAEREREEKTIADIITKISKQATSQRIRQGFSLIEKPIRLFLRVCVWLFVFRLCLLALLLFRGSMMRSNYPLQRVLVAATLLVVSCLVAATVAHAISASNYTAVEQTNTLAFLRDFATINPHLSFAGSDTADFCTWMYVSCISTTEAVLDFQAAGTSALTMAMTLPELSGSVDGSAVVFTAIRASEMGELLAGTLPSTWGRLTRLQVLHLNDNALTGTLPSAWSGMSSLYGLRLDGNNLSGTVPAEWSKLSQFQ